VSGQSQSEAPSLERLYSIRQDGSRRFLHPADVRGRFIRSRRFVFAILIVIYGGLPILQIGGHPAVHLDIAERHFYLFGAVFNATDVWLVMFALLAFAFGLLFMTSWLGRAWCGWGCPQTVFLEGVYRVIERAIDGPGEKRLRLQRGPWTAHKLARRIVKHALYVAVSLLLAHVTVSLFVSGRSLLQMIRHDPRGHLEAFIWTMAMSGALYFNFAWFREQLCIVVCPYGRLQSALVDRDSLIIAYDGRRGEPRGKAKDESRGDCVDCLRCVAVCPTGIDIRNGLQMECVACAQCVDACDEIMDRLGQARGLIRYDSQRALEGSQGRRARPRLYAYAGLFAIALGALCLSAGERDPFEATLVRAQGSPFVVDDTSVRNQFALRLVNKSGAIARFRVLPQASAAQVIVPQATLELAPLESVRVPLFLQVARSGYRGPFVATVAVQMTRDRASPIERRIEARFLGPAPLP
jgi:cytochrome c oxidase accessory protein FixG